MFNTTNRKRIRHFIFVLLKTKKLQTKMSSTKNSKKKNYSESELLEHPLCFTIVYFLRTICAQLHMLVPKQVNDMIDRYVGHGLCKVTALPSSKKCPYTKTYYFNTDCQKKDYKNIKEKIKKLKKENKTLNEPNNLPTLPADWKMFVNPKNHHPDVIAAVLDCHVGGTGQYGVWDYSETKLKKLDAKIRPQHIQHLEKVHGGDTWMHAGRNIREVIPHGSNHGELMALVGWYALEGYVTAEDYNYAKWTTGVQRKPTDREVKACSIGESVYNPVKVKAHKSKGRDLGQCHLNALNLFLSNGSKGYIAVGYHAVCMPMLSIYTIALEPHVVYFDGKHYWDSTTEGPEMMADIGAFVPLVKIDKDNKVHKMDNGNHYRVKNCMIFHEVKLCYAKMQKFYNNIQEMKSKMAEIGDDSFIVGFMGNFMSDTLDANERALKYECELFYRIMKGFNDDGNIRMLCREMCDRSPWLTNPFVVDPTPGVMGIPGLRPISELGKPLAEEKSDEITQKMISSIFTRREAIARELGYSEGADGYDKVLKELKRWSLTFLPRISTGDKLMLTVEAVEEEAKKHLREFMYLEKPEEKKPNPKKDEVLNIWGSDKKIVLGEHITDAQRKEWRDVQKMFNDHVKNGGSVEELMRQQFGIIQQAHEEKKTGSNPHPHKSDMMKSGIAGENKGNCQMSSLPDPANPGRMPGQMSNGQHIQDLLTPQQNADLSRGVLARQNKAMNEARALGASEELVQMLSTGELKSWIETRKLKKKILEEKARKQDLEREKTKLRVQQHVARIEKRNLEDEIKAEEARLERIEAEKAKLETSAKKTEGLLDTATITTVKEKLEIDEHVTNMLNDIKKWCANKDAREFTCTVHVLSDSKLCLSNDVFEELSLQRSRAFRKGYSGVQSDANVMDIIVQRITVHEKYQRKGIATRVLNALIDCSKSIGTNPVAMHRGVHLQQCITPESKALAHALVRDHFWYYQMIEGDVNVFSPIGDPKFFTIETYIEMIDGRGLMYRKPERNKRMRMLDTVKVPVNRLKWNTKTMPGDTEDTLDDYIRRKRHYISGNAKRRGFHGPWELIEMKIVDLQPGYPRGILVAPTGMLNNPLCQFTVDTFEVVLHDIQSNRKEEFNKTVRREWKWHHQEKSNKCNYEARFLPDVIGRVTRAMSRKLTDREIQLVEEVRQVLEAEWKDKDKKNPPAKKRKMSDEETPIEKEQKELKRLDEKYHLKSIDPGKYNRHALAACMLTWARIAGLSKWTKDEATHTEDPVLYAKYIDLTICFEMNAKDRATVEEMADYEMNCQLYRVLKVMSNKNLLDRLKQFHIEYMKISEEALNKFMEQYRIYFDQTMKYEMVVWTRLQELRPNFKTNEDEAHYKEVLEMLNSVEPEWRERASKDMRVVGVMEASECENCGGNLNSNDPE